MSNLTPKKICYPEVNTFYVWDISEIKRELVGLLQAAGTARLTDSSASGANVTITLKNPLKVLGTGSTRPDERGIFVNKDTHFCIIRGLEIRFFPLPKDGDTEITFYFSFQLSSGSPDTYANLRDIRQLILDFANRITKTWRY